MSKSLETMRVERSIIRLFNEPELHLYQEYTLPNGKRPDFCGFYYDDDGGLKDILMIEVKVSKDDFCSGYGLNFIGTLNYLAVPEDIEDFAYRFLKTHKLSYVGIISCDVYYDSRIIKSANQIARGYFLNCDENWSFSKELVKAIQENRLEVAEMMSRIQERMQQHTRKNAAG